MPGAEKETFDQKGRTPLHRAVDGGRLDVTRFLLEASPQRAQYPLIKEYGINYIGLLIMI